MLHWFWYVNFHAIQYAYCNVNKEVLSMRSASLHNSHQVAIKDRRCTDTGAVGSGTVASESHSQVLHERAAFVQVILVKYHFYHL